MLMAEMSAYDMFACFKKNGYVDGWHAIPCSSNSTPILKFSIILQPILSEIPVPGCDDLF